MYILSWPERFQKCAMMPDVMTHWLSERSGDATLRRFFPLLNPHTTITNCSFIYTQDSEIIVEVVRHARCSSLCQLEGFTVPTSSDQLLASQRHTTPVTPRYALYSHHLYGVATETPPRLRCDSFGIKLFLQRVKNLPACALRRHRPDRRKALKQFFLRDSPCKLWEIRCRDQWLNALVERIG